MMMQDLNIKDEDVTKLHSKDIRLSSSSFSSKVHYMESCD